MPTVEQLLAKYAVQVAAFGALQTSAALRAPRG